MKLSLKHGLFLGFLLGVVSAFLYAPKAGKEIREELKGKLDSVPQNFFSLLESLVDLIMSVLDFAICAFEGQKEKISTAINAGISVAKEKSNELRSFTAKVSAK